jgi:acetylornithine deacetylase/succinyl-diaminopimelate desuccinylase-like protein
MSSTSTQSTGSFDITAEDSVTLTQILTGIDSSNVTLSATPGAGETRIADYLTAWLEHRGIETHRIENVPGRPSIVGVIRGSGGGKSLMLNGHIDTVSLTSYESDPLSGHIGEKSGRPVIFGRGALDMKSGLAAEMAALAAIKANKTPLRGDVIFAAVSDEEDASQGTRDLIASGWRADGAVIPEPTNRVLITAHKGFVWVEIDILGTAAHGSDASSGVDAILQAGWFLTALEEYQSRLPVDDMIGPASLHCSLVHGGEEPSSYPAKCTVTVEFRTIPVQSDELILSDLKKILGTIAQTKPTFRFNEPRLTLSRPSYKLPIQHWLVQQTAAIAQDVYGSFPSIESMAIWCDAALLATAEIPTIVIGPAGQGLHAKEEWVDVQSIRETEKIFIRLISEICN